MTDPGGEPVVLVPGLMCDARLFAAQAAHLSRRRAVIHPPILDAADIGSMAEIVLANAPERFALLGFSLGGVVAMEIVERAPERVTRLALLDTDSHGERPEVAALREPQIAAARAGRLDEVMNDFLAAGMIGPGDNRAEVRALAMQMARDLGPNVYVAQSRALQKRRNRQNALRKIGIPTLFLCGRHDGLCPPKRHETMAGLVPGAALEVIDGAGHYPPLEEPELVNAALSRWLNGTLLLV